MMCGPFQRLMQSCCGLTQGSSCGYNMLLLHLFPNEKVVTIPCDPSAPLLYLPKSKIFCPCLCMNSPYSCALASSKWTRFNTSGRLVTMPVPRGRKSLPTTASSTEDFPELCNHTARLRLSLQGWVSKTGRSVLAGMSSS